MTNYLQDALAQPTQREQASPNQIMNSAGGYTFAVDDWTRLQRFLVLGAEGNTYYATERKLVRENAQIVEKLAKTDGPRLVREIVEISDSGRAPKNDPAIFALAIAAKQGDAETRTLAYAALPKVCRIGTHVYHFASFINSMGGWGRGARRAIAAWFNTRTVDDLAFQLIKYQQRDGWSARDLLRLSHVKPASDSHNAIYKWATSGYDAVGEAGLVVPPIVEAFEELKVTPDSKRIIKLIRDYKLPREAVPTLHLTEASVWEALLPHMGLTALVRNLATMTRVGLLAPLSSQVKDVIARITDSDQLRKARVHPIQMLSALKTYAQGHGERGNNTWAPVQPLIDALDAGFYASFANVEPTNKSTLIALDVSGSMSDGTIAGCPGLTPRIASAAMALVTAAREPNHHIVGFSAAASGYGGKWGGGSPGLTDIPITPRMRLDAAIAAIEKIPMGGTDCALPMVWATAQLARGVKVESFAVYTDSETYAGVDQPHYALQKYRKASNVPAKLAVVGMTATEVSIADPNDPGMMDFTGFDAAAPALMNDFFRA